MKYLKIIVIALVVLVSSTAFAPKEIIKTRRVAKEKLEWFTNFDKANEISLETGKPIFAFFTGSDWCGWCVRLQNNVFSKATFVEWAQKNVVLLELDFPKRKQLPEDLKKQNYDLARALNVRGYPTVWLINTKYNKESRKVEISPLGSTGYPSGAVAGKEELKFIADANRILGAK